MRGWEGEFAVLEGWWGSFEGHFESSSVCRFLVSLLYIGVRYCSPGRGEEVVT